ncbi:Hypothetical protein Bdt_1399 [Bdellovibrio bacteriovorus str. Tiberius]|uniref:Uncharacterized protein n=1 Tax=Bdellovibrio bacteriovorus str. Tiberius TaxID=1069642 RepID=K7ZF31_BDEBC|nr:Hypothetical protein Bdt_1399 [Bdellovibrio bacteriovorus str. Tiberius]
MYSELRSEDSRVHNDAAIEQVEVIAEEAVRK